MPLLGKAMIAMINEAIGILDARRIMALATVRPDGWPQTTLVGYANDGLTIYFMIFRTSQKFRNIAKDDRVSLAVGEEPPDIHLAKAVFAAARSAEVTDPIEREQAWQLLVRRHPNLVGRPMPENSVAAMMRAACEHVSVLDYTKGLGHTDALHFAIKPTCQETDAGPAGTGD